MECAVIHGFMYAAVGSYVIQAWRFLNVRIENFPPYWLATLIALAIYVNFFAHHFTGDYRWYLTAFILGLYARTMVYYTPYDKERKMPLLLSFVLIGFLSGWRKTSVPFRCLAVSEPDRGVGDRACRKMGILVAAGDCHLHDCGLSQAH